MSSLSTLVASTGTPFTDSALALGFALLIGHALCDFALQGDFLSIAKNRHANLTKFFGNIARYLVLIMSVLACLSAFGIETTSFAAVLGAAGLAIGLALQGSLSNFSSGVMLLVFRPFKVGDYINAAGVSGTVDAVTLM